MIQTGVRIEDKTNDDLDSIALAMGIPKQAVIRNALTYYINVRQDAVKLGRDMQKARQSITAKE
jgi:predicted transcriptional regulator